MDVVMKRNFIDGVEQIQNFLMGAEFAELNNGSKKAVSAALQTGGNVVVAFSEYKDKLVNATKKSFTPAINIDIEEPATYESKFVAPEVVKPMDALFDKPIEDLSQTMVIPSEQVNTALTFGLPKTDIVPEQTFEQPEAFVAPVEKLETLEAPETLSAIVNDTDDNVLDFNEEVKEEKGKVKLLKRGKSAAYVDTVILCLIAQLGIFGLLIVVLLIIK